jgi:hypothetical protein
MAVVIWNVAAKTIRGNVMDFRLDKNFKTQYRNNKKEKLIYTKTSCVFRCQTAIASLYTLRSFMDFAVTFISVLFFFFYLADQCINHEVLFQLVPELCEIQGTQEVGEGCDVDAIRLVEVKGKVVRGAENGRHLIWWQGCKLAGLVTTQITIISSLHLKKQI